MGVASQQQPLSAERCRPTCPALLNPRRFLAPRTLLVLMLLLSSTRSGSITVSVSCQTNSFDRFPTTAQPWRSLPRRRS